MREIHDRPAVHLPEPVRIERFDELSQRRANERLAVFREYARVLVVRLEIADVLDRYQPHLLPHRRTDPCEPLRCSAGYKDRHKPRERFEDGAQVGRGGAIGHALLQALDRLREARVRHRLQQVIDGRALERVDGVLVERGHEHDMELPVGSLCHFESRETGHPDIEKRDVGILGGDERLRLGSVCRDPGDHELRPQSRKPVTQILRETRLVVGDDRRCSAHAVHDTAANARWPCLSGPGSDASGTAIVTRDPCGSTSSTIDEAASPYAAASRARRFASPMPGVARGIVARKPRPVSATLNTSIDPSRRAAIVISTPATDGSRPCLTAFSTIGCNSIGDTSMSASDAGMSIRQVNRAPMRNSTMSRYARSSATWAPSVPLPAADEALARSSTIRRSIIPLAFDGSWSMSETTCASVL